MKKVLTAVAALALTTAPVYAQQVNTQKAPVVAQGTGSEGVVLGNTGLLGLGLIPVLLGTAGVVTIVGLIVANNDSSSDTSR